MSRSESGMYKFVFVLELAFKSLARCVYIDKNIDIIFNKHFNSSENHMDSIIIIMSNNVYIIK